MTNPSEPVNISAQLVKELRERTGAGFSDCRSALVESKGNIEGAIDVLRKKGQAAAQKKAARQATEGLIGHYIHAGGKIGVIIEVNCESDFVARTDDFQRLCHDVAMHIAALDTRYVRREEVTQEILDREREIYKAQARATGKPEPVIEKIVNGKMEKFYEENCLYEQHFIKDESVTVGELVSQMIHKLGENIAIRRYVRFKVGESAAHPPNLRRPLPLPRISRVLATSRVARYRYSQLGQPPGRFADFRADAVRHGRIFVRMPAESMSKDDRTSKPGSTPHRCPPTNASF